MQGHLLHVLAVMHDSLKGIACFVNTLWCVVATRCILFMSMDSHSEYLPHLRHRQTQRSEYTMYRK